MVEETLRSATGTDVESLCSKCGDVWQVVLDHRQGVIDRCQCKECGKTQKYKPTDPRLIAALTELRGRRLPRPRKARNKEATGRSRTKSATELRVAIDVSRPLVPYDMKGSYVVADQIEHGKFGKGIVIALLGSDKISVEFVGAGAKTLMCRRT